MRRILSAAALCLAAWIMAAGSLTAAAEPGAQAGTDTARLRAASPFRMPAPAPAPPIFVQLRVGSVRLGAECTGSPASRPRPIYPPLQIRARGLGRLRTRTAQLRVRRAACRRAWHGKAVISSYVLGNAQSVRRGIALSFAAAIVQALAAVLLVGIMALVLNMAGLKIQAWSNRLETASYALIMGVGSWLLISQVRALLARRAAVARQGPEGASPECHQHNHDHAHHEHREDCGHAHMPDPRLLAGPASLKKMVAIVLAVGIRPCTGAILVLFFALAQGLFWAGVAATFAMALGTAITVSALAALAVGSRQLALRFASGSGGWTETIWSACGIGGAMLVLTLGAILFTASLGPARPL